MVLYTVGNSDLTDQTIYFEYIFEYFCRLQAGPVRLVAYLFSQLTNGFSLSWQTIISTIII